MQPKFIKVWTLVLLQIVIVGNLQMLPATAVYGFSLPYLYFLAAIGFFIPCVLMTGRLATQFPQTGGAYIWCEQALGARAGFFAVTILWISNLLWYPSLFSLIAANLAYLYDPLLAQNKLFIVGFSVILFWIITALNCTGIKISTRVSVLCSFVGIILPMILIIICGFIWWWSGKPLATSLVKTPLIPDIAHLNNMGFLLSIVASLVGIEVAAVHAGNVENPKKNFPLSLWISSVLLFTLLIGAGISISIIIPSSELSVLTGLLDALKIFFHESHLSFFIFPILLLVFLGNVGSVAAWMLGCTRGLFVASKKNNITQFLQKESRNQAPIGVLIVGAIIFTLASSIFVIFPKITDSFWLLIALASQISLIYYIILFISAIYLQSWWFIMSVGMLTSLVILLMGFITPPGLDEDSIFLFRLVMSIGLISALILPFLFFRKHKTD
jgi:amino acid transporter